MALDKIIAAIPKMSDNELSRLFDNAQDRSLKGQDPHADGEAIRAIEAEWARRLQAWQAGRYKADTPPEGVLKAIGYRVGNNGLPENRRRQLLDFAITGTLPPVGSPAHMAEWGGPLSRTRYAKLHRVIRVLASSAHAMGNMEVAAQDWEADLVYLEQNWRHQCR